MKFGFEISIYEVTFYIKHKKEQILIVPLYVDDLVVIGSNKILITKFKREMESRFEMTTNR